MRISPSALKLWQRCPLQYRFSKIDDLPREQTSATSFGTVIHDAVQHMEEAGSLEVGLRRFDECWSDLSILGVEYDSLMPRSSHQGYADDGKRILSDWWKIFQWDTDVVLAREHPFEVPLGPRHSVSGFVDKLLLRTLKGGEVVVVASDYKTNSKLPTREYLKHDLQFSAYCYATTRPEFWESIPNGPALFEQLRDARRMGEWVHLKGPKRIDAGERRQAPHYNRLAYAADALEASIECGIFVPNISGESCEWCPYRRQCGLSSDLESE